MQERYQKASLTKIVNRYLKTTYQVLKLSGKMNSGNKKVVWSVIITPGTHILILSFSTEVITDYSDRVSVSRFSDFIVRNGGYEEVINKFINYRK
jgi:hypothetical protein